MVPFKTLSNHVFTLTRVSFHPPHPINPQQEIVTSARREASTLDDTDSRQSLLLRTKRDLYLLAFDGVVDLLKRSEAPDAGAILEAVKDIFSDICDDWRDLVHASRVAAVEAKNETHRANSQKDRAEQSMSELYDAAKSTEKELRIVTKERDALREQLKLSQHQVEHSEMVTHEVITSVRARGSVGTMSQTTNGSPCGSPEFVGSSSTKVQNDVITSQKEDTFEASKKRVSARLSYKPSVTINTYKNDENANDVDYDSASESASECGSDRDDLIDELDALAVKNAKQKASQRSPVAASQRSPVAPSTVSPTFARSLRGAMYLGNRVAGGTAIGNGSSGFINSGHRPQPTTPFDQKIFPENKAPPRWASDTALSAAAAAAARGVSRGGAGQFGPDRRLSGGVSVGNNGGVNSHLTESNVNRQASTRAIRGSAHSKSDSEHLYFFEASKKSQVSSSNGGVSHTTVASARPWTLKQLREVVEEIVSAKISNDHRNAANKKPRETMKEHVFTFLNHKFGVKRIIAEWFESIDAATVRFGGVDCEMACFERIMRNTLDEEYFTEQRMVRDTIEELLKSYVKNKLLKSSGKNNVSDETLRLEFSKKRDGDLFDDEWLDMCRFMYGGKEMAGVVQAVREAQRANENKSFSEELQKLIEENKKPGTRRRSTADLESEAKKAARKRLPYKDFVQTCLFHGMTVHEKVLEPFVDTLQDMNCLQNGVLSEQQFHDLCKLTRPELDTVEVEALVLKLDPWNSGRITVSGAYAALVPGLGVGADEAVTRGLPGTEESKASLGGVGHGRLWTPTYEGNLFSSK